MDTNMDRSAAMEKLKELLKGINFAMLTTTTTNGPLRSRPMTILQAEGDEPLWFFTHAASQKLGEIAEHAEVNLSYMSDSGERYISISGTATVLQDRQKIRQLWNPIFKALYPGGADDPNLVLLQLDVHDAEYWDAPSSKMVQIAGFVKAVATGQRYEPGKNRKLSL